MMMIGHLNASHTGVSGGPNPITSNVPARYPGFDVVSDASGYYKVGHIYKAGPADHDYLKIATGHFIISLDRRPLKTTDNYWRALQVASGNKFHFLVNDKPTAEGAWEVSITPANGGEWTRSAVREVGGRSSRHGHETERRQHRLPAHPRDGCAVACVSSSSISRRTAPSRRW